MISPKHLVAGRLSKTAGYSLLSKQ